MADSQDTIALPESEACIPHSFEDHLIRARGLAKAVHTFALGMEMDYEKIGLEHLALSLNEHLGALQAHFDAGERQ